MTINRTSIKPTGRKLDIDPEHRNDRILRTPDGRFVTVDRRPMQNNKGYAEETVHEQVQKQDNLSRPSTGSFAGSPVRSTGITRKTLAPNHLSTTGSHAEEPR